MLQVTSCDDKFSGMIVKHLPRGPSDHAPLLDAPTGWHYNPFVTLHLKLKAVRGALRSWKKQNFRNINDNLLRYEEEVRLKQELFDLNPSIENRMAMGETNAHLRRAMNQMEMFWAQKACMQWVEDGDKNTAFYHAVVKGNRRRNTITRLQVDGVWNKDQESLKQSVVQYFMSLLQTSEHIIDDNLLEVIPSIVSDAQNMELTFGFSPQLSPKRLKLVRWIPPITGLCLNVDGASKGNPGLCGGGRRCIRDEHGSVRVAFAHFYNDGTSMIAETRALCDGLRLADFLGLHLSIVYTDSSVLANSFKEGRCPSWRAYRWWWEANARIQRSACTITHVYWEANQVADGLANYGCLLTDTTRKTGYTYNLKP
ncbi:hypothetical protein Taro_034013 [Colocasia esculenta]|uniref:RNase H type-1 domain-containing protein n=1 Tax=Colocasia esculenta TaxID=4460 RepID=A0A843W6C9_COLES|nr:hypothetical protein [Colocasia esculenta]